MFARGSTEWSLSEKSVRTILFSATYASIAVIHFTMAGTEDGSSIEMT